MQTFIQYKCNLCMFTMTRCNFCIHANRSYESDVMAKNYRDSLRPCLILVCQVIIYDDIIAKLASNERANVPKRQTYYGRDLVGTVAEWYFFRWSDFIPSCVVMDTYASFVCVYLHVFRCIESL